MFVRKSRDESNIPFPPHLHDWVRRAVEGSSLYRANPARPVIRAVENGRLKDIKHANPDYLQFGDIVALTFMVAYIEGRYDWFPQYHVVDIVRVATSDSADFSRYAVPMVDERTRAALQEGEIVDPQAAATSRERGMDEEDRQRLPLFASDPRDVAKETSLTAATGSANAPAATMDDVRGTPGDRERMSTDASDAGARRDEMEVDDEGWAADGHAMLVDLEAQEDRARLSDESSLTELSEPGGPRIRNKRSKATGARGTYARKTGPKRKRSHATEAQSSGRTSRRVAQK